MLRRRSAKGRHRHLDRAQRQTYLPRSKSRAGASMQVSKWRNSLAIRLPASGVEPLQIKARDEIEVHVGGTRAFGIEGDAAASMPSHASAPFASSFPLTFDREEANAR